MRIPIRPRFLIPLIVATIVGLGLMLAQDQETLRIVSAVSAEDLRASARLELETWQARSPLLKARAWFWSAFGEVF